MAMRHMTLIKDSDFRNFHWLAAYLDQVVLDDVADDSVVVEVPGSAFDSEVLLESDLNIRYVLTVPPCIKERVLESQYHQILFSKAKSM